MQTRTLKLLVSSRRAILSINLLFGFLKTKIICSDLEECGRHFLQNIWRAPVTLTQAGNRTHFPLTVIHCWLIQKFLYYVTAHLVLRSTLHIDTREQLPWWQGIFKHCTMSSHRRNWSNSFSIMVQKLCQIRHKTNRYIGKHTCTAVI